MAVIFVVSAQRSVPSVAGRWDVVVKKAMHVAAYGILTWLYLRALRGTTSDDTPVRAVAAALALTYALSDEYHQGFVPGRNASLSDVLIDGVGVIAVILLDGSHHRATAASVQIPSE